MEPAPTLKQIPDKASLSDVENVVIENYGIYHILVVKYNAWQEWYNKQQDASK
jgi:hypothetical protein